MLENDNPSYVEAVIGRALVAIFNRQTETEKKVNTTNQHNMIGFTGVDALSGSITAKYYIKHKKLLQWQIDRWLKQNKNGVPRIAKYHKQLNEIANEKR